MGAAAWQDRQSFLPSYWQARIDLVNLRTLIRGKHLGFDRARVAGLLLPGGRSTPDRILPALDIPGRKLRPGGGRDHTEPWCQALRQSPRPLAAWSGPARIYLLEKVKPAKVCPVGARIRCSATTSPRNMRRAWSTWC